MLSSLILAASQLQAKNSEVLTFDKNETKKNGLPRNFRDLSEFGLNAIASAQFSEKELQAIRAKFPDEEIIIVDLRRESHGLINGLPVSWREKFDSSNAGKTVKQIISDEEERFNLVKKDKKIIVNKILEKDKENGWYESLKPESIEVFSATTEENLAKKNGFFYKRFVVQDHAKPDDKQMQEMLKFLLNLPANKKIYVHCAAGKGRTTTLLTFYDILKNGHELTLEEIIKRQYKIGGSNLYEVEDDEPKWRSDLAKERVEMLQKFYNENRGRLK
jgi:protein-tyrosine phosphatase